MEELTLVGLILIILGIVMAPFTCFMSLFPLTIIGIILIIIGESQRTPTAPQYPPPQYPPPQYPPPQYPPQYTCPSCGASLNYVQQYNRWYCPYCRAYR